MESKALDQISKEISIDLPENYRTFMLGFPDELYDLENEAGEAFSDYEFLDEAERIIELNEEAREDPYYSEEDEEEKPWPPNFLVIGENGNGDYYCIDTENDASPVYFFDHNDGDFIECADDLDTYVEFLKNGPNVDTGKPDPADLIPADDEDEDDE